MMALGGLMAILDDLTVILDDVAVMSKLAAKKTAGIAGDDLAVGANTVVGLDPKRELPIVGKIALGSALIKIPLIALALALPQAVITPLLMLGGAFLCYEGYHKITHKKDAQDEAHHKEMLAAMTQGPDALLKLEQSKVKDALVTDVILSAEIVAVALGAISDADFATKAVTLCVVAFGMTAVIYGLIALIVKIDDFGLWLQKKKTVALKRFGEWLVRAMPMGMRGLSVVGTAAMFIVGGGIIMHGLPLPEVVAHQEGVSGLAVSALAGCVFGFICAHGVHFAQKFLPRKK